MLSDLFGSSITKGLLIATLLFLSTSALMTHLYLGTRDELAALESKHTQLKQELKGCSESKSKVIEGAKQDDALNVDKEGKLSALEDEKDALLKRLEILSKTKKCSTTKLPSSTTNTLETPPNEIININDSWDADVQQLLDNTYRSNKRDSNPTP